jgi:hypothetical protein
MNATIVALSAITIVLQLVDILFGVFTNPSVHGTVGACGKVGAAARHRLH